MTNANDLNPKSYAVVYFYDNGVPGICMPVNSGVKIDGRFRAIYEDPSLAAEQFAQWPANGRYGILPLSHLVEETTVTTLTFKSGALDAYT